MRASQDRAEPCGSCSGQGREAADEQEKFWQEHYQEFLEKHPDQFVAVYKGSIVATNEDLQQLVHIVRDTGMKVSDVWVRFITANPRRVLL